MQESLPHPSYISSGYRVPVSSTNSCIVIYTYSISKMCKCKYPKWLKANSAFSNLMTVFLRRKKTQKAEKTEKKKRKKQGNQFSSCSTEIEGGCLPLPKTICSIQAFSFFFLQCLEKKNPTKEFWLCQILTGETGFGFIEEKSLRNTVPDKDI